MLIWKTLQTLLSLGCRWCLGCRYLFDMFCFVPTNTGLPFAKLIWQWKITMFERKYIFKGSLFHSYVSLPECIHIAVRPATQLKLCLLFGLVCARSAAYPQKTFPAVRSESKPLLFNLFVWWSWDLLMICLVHWDIVLKMTFSDSELSKFQSLICMLLGFGTMRNCSVLFLLGLFQKCYTLFFALLALFCRRRS